MKILRLYLDKDAEEIWLNELVGKGWALSNFFFGVYTFERCEENEFIYKIDLMDSFSGTKSSMDYIKFVEETGAEYVSSWGRWVFFRKPAIEGPFELYTDVDSQIKVYEKIRNMLGIVAIFEFVIGFSQLHNLGQYGAGIGYYSLTGVIFFLGGAIGFAALKAHHKINSLRKQKVI
jgi:hypothetical protein